MTSDLEKDDGSSTDRTGPNDGTTPNAPPAPKIITDAQARVMLIVIVVALIAAAAIVGTWWARRAGAATPEARATIVIPSEARADNLL